MGDERTAPRAEVTPPGTPPDTEGTPPGTRAAAVAEPATPSDVSIPPRAKRPEKRLNWRPWLRAMHRDVGYLLVGLTLIYALSGLAVNHIADWDPNFVEREATHALPLPLPPGDAAIAAVAMKTAGRSGTVADVFRTSESELEITLPNATLIVHTDTGRVLERSREPRLLLRVANWLHLNRGKKAWTLIADGYAVLLVFLATSGMFMLPGKKGLIGRGGLLVIAGGAVPALYVVLSGGP